MEKLAEVDTVVFDKTGTLTHGSPSVGDVLPTRSISRRHLLGLSAAAETHLQHPVADALREGAREIAPIFRSATSPATTSGSASRARSTAITSTSAMSVSCARAALISAKPCATARRWRSRAIPASMSALDGKLAGLIPYADQIRPESREVISRLRASGVKNTIMLTGDNNTVARAVSQRLGLTGHFADMLPADKAEAIQELQREGKVVAMVGDGINDSPALSFADVGVAMKYGAEVTQESADVVLMEDSLWKLVEAVEISRGAMGLIRQNYGVVIGMNTVALALALPGGLISPSATALISNGSAILASLNGLRPLMRIG